MRVVADVGRNLQLIEKIFLLGYELVVTLMTLPVLLLTVREMTITSNLPSATISSQITRPKFPTPARAMVCMTKYEFLKIE